MDRIVIAITSAAVAGMIGFGSGALLTRPNREETKATIAAIRAEADKVKKVERENAQAAKAEAAHLRNELTRVTTELEQKKEKLSKFRDAILGAIEDKRKKQLTNLLKSLDSMQKRPGSYSLAGLKAVRVLVGDISTEAQNYGLSKQQLQTQVELRLRQSGIGVLSEQELQEWFAESLVPPAGWLSINVNAMLAEDIGLAAVSIQLNFSQPVLLARDTTKFGIGSTWDSGSVATGGLKKLKDIRELVKDHVDGFINDYLAANPKKGTADMKQQGANK